MAENLELFSTSGHFETFGSGRTSRNVVHRLADAMPMRTYILASSSKDFVYLSRQSFASKSQCSKPGLFCHSSSIDGYKHIFTSRLCESGFINSSAGSRRVSFQRGYCCGSECHVLAGTRMSLCIYSLLRRLQGATFLHSCLRMTGFRMASHQPHH